LGPALTTFNSIPINGSCKEESGKLAAKIIASKPVYLDTETTGLEKQDEIVEISILDFDGTTLLESYVRPVNPLTSAATRIHGITNAMVTNAPTWPALWHRIRGFLFSRLIAAYNAPFDLRMMRQSHARYKIPWRESFDWVDVMILFSNYRGIWDPVRKTMKYFSLTDAGKYFNISLPNSHRASADALLTRAVLHCQAGVPY
jgi:DNA polymerase III epsilon subunit-like protein